MENLWLYIKNIKAENIRFDNEMSGREGWSIGPTEDLHCEINAMVDEWEQVFILLHEALHDHPDFQPTKPVFVDPELEAAIDEKVIEIIRSQPELVAYITRQLRKAKVLEFHKSLVPYVSQIKIMLFKSWVDKVERTGISIWVQRLDEVRNHARAVGMVT